MGAWGRSLYTALIVLLSAGLLMALLTPATTTRSAQAQIVTDFSLQVSTGTITANGDSSDVVVSLAPGQSAIAAVGGIITFDAPAVQVTECVALIGLGVCNTDTPGLVNLQSVDPNGWTSPTDLFRLTFSAQDLATDAALQITLVDAYDLSGTQIAGETVDGNLDLAVNGDVNCDGALTIADALLIAQFVVGLREGSTCPRTAVATQINLDFADVDRNGRLDIADALRAARCTVGVLDCGN